MVVMSMKRLLNCNELEEINKELPNMDESLDKDIKEYRLRLIEKISKHETENNISETDEKK